MHLSGWLRPLPLWEAAVGLSYGQPGGMHAMESCPASSQAWGGRGAGEAWKACDSPTHLLRESWTAAGSLPGPQLSAVVCGSSELRVFPCVYTASEF